MSFTIPIESAYAVPITNEENTAVFECINVATGGTCENTGLSTADSGNNRLLVVFATLDSEGADDDPTIASIVAGNPGTSSDTLTQAAFRTDAGGDHHVAVYYLHETNWVNFNPGSNPNNDIGLTVTIGGGDLVEVSLTVLMLSGIDSTGTVVDTLASGANDSTATDLFTPASAGNVVVAAALFEGLLQTEDDQGVTDLNTPEDAAAGHVHMAGIDLTPVTSSTTYGWISGTGPNSVVIVELERKRIGPKARRHMGKLVTTFSGTNPEEIISSLQKNGKYDFDIDGETISLDNEDFVIDFDASENFAVSKRDNYIVFISTSRNREMMAKGLVKDIARRLQTLRKERGYKPTDVLGVASILDLDKESLEMIKERTKDLAFLVRVKQVNFTESCKEYKDDDIDGQKIRISVE